MAAFEAAKGSEKLDRRSKMLILTFSSTQPVVIAPKYFIPNLWREFDGAGDNHNNHQHNKIAGVHNHCISLMGGAVLQPSERLGWRALAHKST